MDKSPRVTGEGRLVAAAWQARGGGSASVAVRGRPSPGYFRVDGGSRVRADPYPDGANPQII